MKVISKISIIIVAFLVGVRCIDRFDIKDAEKVSDILIVEGMIAEGVSNIILSKGYPLGQNISVRNYVNNAEVLVECSDGTVFSCNGEIIEGKYKIEIFDFKPQTQYRLRIKLDKKEYLSEYLSPLHTPEIDELKFTKNQRMDPISVQVSTHDPENQSRYYSWEYEEIWEIEAPLLCWYEFDENLNYTVSYSKDKNTPPICPRYYCWKYNNSLSFIFGHPREGEANIIKDLTLFEINPTSDKLSKLYYIKIKQTQVRKEYYDYFSSIIKKRRQGPHNLHSFAIGIKR